PKVLDAITAGGGKFRIANITIGQARHDPSNALIDVRTRTEEVMERILAQIADHGAVPTTKQDCRLVEADMDGALPDTFYSTTNQRTEVRLDGHWVEVADQEMDCGIVVESSPRVARCIPMLDVRRRMPIVTGHVGVRVIPEQRT